MQEDLRRRFCCVRAYYVQYVLTANLLHDPRILFSRRREGDRGQKLWLRT